MRDLLGTSNDTYLVEGANLRTQAAMDAEDLAVNDCTKHEEIEHLTASFPNGSIAVLLLALFVESVDLSDLAGLMIAAYKGHAIRVSGAGDQPNFEQRVDIADLALRQSSNVKVSKLKYPRSTKSPRKM